MCHQILIQFNSIPIKYYIFLKYIYAAVISFIQILVCSQGGLETVIDDFQNFATIFRVHNAPVYALHCKSLQRNRNKRTDASVQLSCECNTIIKICMV